ncbi:RNA 2'-phosphotransferase [Vibrio ruber]|uniref:RNA 2'-phosphotransferase n=1 Tax=Vibrio ruber TaxID=184755 RepID=UPI00289326E4|nr:RNA 2'-phosphotransferase [Vibrio ruber]WNJ95671.1 RNA 2'-phosphotransferase [Vibrio ruber]
MTDLGIREDKNMTSQNQLKHISKFLSFVLRHKPEAIELTLAPYGWDNIDELIDNALIQQVVKTSDKQRFIISEDGEYIRANQGHSIHVDLQLKPVAPPEFLYHGTAIAVGQRYGKPAVLKIKAHLMHEQGFDFYVSENGVWLTSYVLAKYITIHHHKN